MIRMLNVCAVVSLHTCSKCTAFMKMCSRHKQTIISTSRAPPDQCSRSIHEQMHCTAHYHHTWTNLSLISFFYAITINTYNMNKERTIRASTGQNARSMRTLNTGAARASFITTSELGIVFIVTHISGNEVSLYFWINVSVCCVRS